ncbi:MAG TPA: DivIVA domain-containing protein [Trueperaceae bacterium]
MRLSPLEIEHMEFPRGAGGYQRRHVRDFLERVASEVADLLKEVQDLQGELDASRQQVAELQAKEAELQRAVIAAERIANEIKENAKREAKLILDEAERVRERRLADLDAEVARTRADLDRLQREQALFREQFRALLQAYSRSLEALGGKTTAGEDAAEAATVPQNAGE